jgi:hypothetical protein
MIDINHLKVELIMGAPFVIELQINVVNPPSVARDDKIALCFDVSWDGEEVIFRIAPILEVVKDIYVSTYW